MDKRILLFAVALGLAVVASPLVGTASAEVCHVDDVECHERKARCYLKTVTNPFDPTFCTL